MTQTNPYNCTIPGHLFVGHERLRRHLLDGFCNGNSFAVLGGRRCGKTSLLFQIRSELETGGLEPFTPLPRYLDIQSLNSVTPGDLFETIYNLATRGASAPPWSPPKRGREYQGFLAQLDQARTAMEKQHGSRWLVILLVDELDAAIGRLPDDQFFQNLRNLLMVSDFHRHFRLVATGVSGMGDLISSGSSPLNNLRHRYLSILSSKQAHQLLAAGFGEPGLDPETEVEVLRVTGRHPYLMQGVLDFLWQDTGGRGEAVDRKQIRVATREFLREHSDFPRWLDQFGPAEHEVYRSLADAPDGTMGVSELRRAIDPAIQDQTDHALTVLSYHAVIDDSDLDEPRLAGTLFRDWYRDHVPWEPRPPAPPADPPQPATPQPPGITIEVKPNIEVNPRIHAEINRQTEIRTGLTAAEAARLLSTLLHELPAANADEVTAVKARHALELAELEARKAASSGDDRVDGEKVAGHLEQAVTLLKNAGAGTDALTTFIHKAEKLAPYLGKAAGWLMTLL